MSDNPYTSPVSEPLPASVVPQAAGELPIASQGKRFLNLLIDNAVTYVLSMMVGFVVGVIYGIRAAMSGGGVTADDEFTMQIIGTLVGLLVTIGYYLAMEALFQRTVAKWITGTCVVSAQGGRPSFGQIVGRSFARLIPFEPFSFLGRQQPVGWHDSLSGTRVVRTR